MNLIKQFLLLESQKAAQVEIEHTVSIINKIYNEWKKTTRRVNAVDIITTSINKISTINPEAIDRIHDTAKLKLATIIMRCLDLPPWRNIETKKSLYKKLFTILKKVQLYDPNTGSGGNLRETIMTRFSASISYNLKSKVFVSYEPTIPNTYLKYLFSDQLPEKNYKMSALSLPEDFSNLVDILTVNHEKAEKKFKKNNKEETNE